MTCFIFDDDLGGNIFFTHIQMLRSTKSRTPSGSCLEVSMGHGRDDSTITMSPADSFQLYQAGSEVSCDFLLVSSSNLSVLTPYDWFHLCQILFKLRGSIAYLLHSAQSLLTLRVLRRLGQALLTASVTWSELRSRHWLPEVASRCDKYLAHVLHPPSVIDGRHSDPSCNSPPVRVLLEFPLLVPFIVLLPLSVSALAY